MKIFGREPVVILAFVYALISAASVFLFHWSTDQVALVNAGAAAVIGIIVAITVHDGVQAAFLGVIKALLSIALGFGLHLSPEAQFVVMLLANTGSALFVRTQVTAPVPSSQV